ncbi:hypothetical protein A3860_36185 [Niastella vici]|uniref:Uncharacterized protein n=1 Tax=Niastella vici TaxID=1703345 RepID=A0A1V9FMY2_9BACT|nr:hypothetical protein A3860_36185 [Niastella vici]
MYYLKRSCFNKCLSFFKLFWFKNITQTVALFNYVIYWPQKAAETKLKDRFRNWKRSFSNGNEIYQWAVLSAEPLNHAQLFFKFFELPAVA